MRVVFLGGGVLPLAEQDKLLLLPEEWRENQKWDERGFSQREPRLVLTGSWKVSLRSRPMLSSLRATFVNLWPDQSGFLS